MRSGKWMIIAFLTCLCFINTSYLQAAQTENNSFKLVEVRKIWDAAPHNAFTDLIWLLISWAKRAPAQKSDKVNESKSLLITRNFNTTIKCLIYCRQ